MKEADTCILLQLVWDMNLELVLFFSLDGDWGLLVSANLSPLAIWAKIGRWMVDVEYGLVVHYLVSNSSFSSHSLVRDLEYSLKEEKMCAYWLFNFHFYSSIFNMNIIIASLNRQHILFAVAKYGFHELVDWKLLLVLSMWSLNISLKYGPRSDRIKWWFVQPTPTSLAWCLDGLIFESEICLAMKFIFFSY